MPALPGEGIAVNRRQLVEALATHFEGNKKQAGQALDAVLDTITREVARGEKVAIKGFGAFEKAVRPARMVRNPSTGELFQASAKVVMLFRPSAQLRDVISGAAQLPARTLGAAMAAGGAFMGLTEPAPADATRKSSRDPVRADVAQSVPVKSTTSATTARKSTAGTTAKKATARKATSGTTAKKASSGTTAKKASSGTAAKKSAAKKTTGQKATAKKTPSSTTTKKSTTRRTSGRATKKSAAGAPADNTPSATSESPG